MLKKSKAEASKQAGCEQQQQKKAKAESDPKGKAEAAKAKSFEEGQGCNQGSGRPCKTEACSRLRKRRAEKHAEEGPAMMAAKAIRLLKKAKAAS